MNGSRSTWIKDWLPPAVVIITTAVFWEIAAWASGLPPLVLPPLSRVFAAGWDRLDLLGGAVATTLLETGLGLTAAVALGIALAAVIDFSPLMRRALRPLLVASQTVNPLSIAPLMVIWFGFGLLPTVVIVVLVCFFPVAVNAADGLASADPELIALLRAMGASRRQIFRMVRLPAALPAFFSGLRVAVTYSVVGATIGEWVGATAGLGYYMLSAKNALATDRVFVGILVTTGLSIGLFGLVVLAERLALPWYYTAQRAEQWDDIGIY